MCLPAGRSSVRDIKKTFYPTPLGSPSFLHAMLQLLAPTLAVDALARLFSQSSVRKPDDTLSHAATCVQLSACVHTARMSDVIHVLDTGLPPDLLRGHYCNSPLRLSDYPYHTTFS